MAQGSTGGVEGEIQVKLALSADDFGRVLERMGFSPEQATGMAAGGGEERIRGKPVNLEKSIRTSPTFMSIFKPVAALMGINLGIQGILGHSRIAGTYLGAMGKMFGAAIDLLLMPFIPLFNVLMLGMSMLVKWLITSGVLEEISKGVIRFMNFVKNEIWPPLQELVEGIKEMDAGKIAGAIWDLGSTTMKAWMQSLINDPLKTIAGTLAAMLVLQKVSSVFGLGKGGGGGLGGVGGPAAGYGLAKTGLLGRFAQAAGITAIAGALSAGPSLADMGWVNILRGKSESALEKARDVGLTVAPFMGGIPAVVSTGVTLYGGGKRVAGAFDGGGDSNNQKAAQVMAKADTWNITIHSNDPWAIRQELERLSNNELAKAGWEGK